jgi:hypothetical protein
MSVIGIVLGNFIYQAITSADWAVAFERSFFMSFGVLGFVFIWQITDRDADHE